MTNHLGSLIGLTDTAGVYVEKYSFDPWGRRRNPSDWSFDNVPAPTITDRGFPGHVSETQFLCACEKQKLIVEQIPTAKLVGKHLELFSSINMLSEAKSRPHSASGNGRLYDPVTGRFLNADPVIDNMGGAQGLNSYTYCLNNPLKFTDPTGYIFRRPPEFEWVDLSEVYYNALRISGYSSPWFDYEFLIGSGGLSRTTTNTQDKITYDPVSGEYVHSDGTVATEEELDALINGKPAGDGDTPWMTIAINEIGVKENSDKTNTPRIIEYFDATELKGQAGTKSWGWCSAFANWVMKQAGYTGTNSGKAESWLNWGTTLSEPVYGCITVTLKNGLYHVGFYSGLGAKEGAINLLGGNQTNQVMYQQYYYFQSDVVRYAWPNP